ncbi:alpha/beta hydrolase [Streptomyces sp. NPDC060194]|uniref:alpha/beta hydrolase n=1 Tax=Streptomyces sp. NPDC060194 TaxID=3347069 RepID=UPI003649C210
MNTRALGLIGAGTIAAGLLTAAPSTAAPDAPAPASVVWKKCATKAQPTQECGTVTSPLDHGNPFGATVTLALTRIPHTAKTSQGPLLVNPGGPGGSGLSMAGFVAGSLPEKVAAQYDVIGFDPRGVGRSEPALDCRPGHFAPTRPDALPGTAAAERANLDRSRAFADGCAKKHADVLPYIDTVSSARDLDVIRRALGAEQLNYFGYSYGTYLGAVYAKLFPGQVRRFVLDSVVDPDGVWYESNLAQNLAFESRHQAFTAWVAKHDATYRLGADPAEVEAKWYAMRSALAAEPAVGPERRAGAAVGASELEDTFIPGGYYDGYWPLLAEAFAAYVNDDDAAPLVAAYDKLGAVDAEGDNGYSVYAAVQCRDAGWPKDWGQWRHDNERSYAKAPFMTWNNAWYNAPCAFWPVHGLTPPDVTNDKVPPVLLFQATEDAATPYDGAVSLKRKLAGSRLVVEEGGGNHGVTLSGNACLDKHLAAYLSTGRLPRAAAGSVADATCAKLPDPEPAAPTPRALGSTSSHGLH